jgi:DNA repair protein RadC
MPSLAQGHRQRLKERWTQAGPKGFNDRDLLELLLTFAIPQKDTKPLAFELLETFGSLDSVLRQDLSSLQRFKGLGEHSSILLNLAGALRKRQTHHLQGITVSGPKDIEDYLLRELGDLPEEKFFVILLNQKNAIIDLVELEHGIENRAHIYLKKMVRVALDRHATAVICVHNHPSGTMDFSPEDICLTTSCQRALKPLEIRLLDHFLVAHSEVFSMKERGISF